MLSHAVILQFFKRTRMGLASGTISLAFATSLGMVCGILLVVSESSKFEDKSRSVPPTAVLASFHKGENGLPSNETIVRAVSIDGVLDVMRRECV